MHQYDIYYMFYVAAYLYIIYKICIFMCVIYVIYLFFAQSCNFLFSRFPYVFRLENGAGIQDLDTSYVLGGKHLALSADGR